MPHPSTLFRRKLKEGNPEKYQEYLLQQRERDQKRREKAKKEWEEGHHTRAQVEEHEAKKEAKRERERQRYEKKKKDCIRQTRRSIAKASTPATKEKKRPRDMSPNELRAHKSNMRQKQRQNLSRQKKTAIRAKERAKYHAKKVLQLQNMAAALPDRDTATATTPANTVRTRANSTIIQAETEKPRVGDYVKLKCIEKKNQKLVYAVVVDAPETGDFSVRFLAECGTAYAFADKEDVGLISTGPPDYYSWDILKSSEVSFVNRGHYFFKK
ncbi:hypothetical protein ElyMa_006308200 [Elysia marginata]|uniref:Uncharacterized protein n=1 Tax=Elysia marginata TaxID=1093978 RepID=A0AAV4HIB4_9GAST|nr:hypothetical protein ElyMa_006308200 [Elysia marginata]